MKSSDSIGVSEMYFSLTNNYKQHSRPIMLLWRSGAARKKEWASNCCMGKRKSGK